MRLASRPRKPEDHPEARYWQGGDQIMPNEVEHSGGQILEGVSAASKNFYSAGASFTTAACASVTFSMWRAVERIWPTFKADWFGFLLSALIVLAYALV